MREVNAVDHQALRHTLTEDRVDWAGFGRQMAHDAPRFDKAAIPEMARGYRSKTQLTLAMVAMAWQPVGRNAIAVPPLGGRSWRIGLAAIRPTVLADPLVMAKQAAAVRWCANASDHAVSHGGMPWRYVLIPHDEIAENLTLEGLAARFCR